MRIQREQTREEHLEVSIHLHGILRDKLSPAAKGRATLTLADGATVADLLAQLDVQRRVVVAINGRSYAEAVTMLQDGDQVVVYTPVGGG